MDISSQYSAPLGLPNGQVVPVRGSVSVKAADWSDMQSHPVVAAWVETGKLKAGDGSKADEPVAFDKMSDDELRALLKDKGVAVDGRWGRDRLVDEAKKLAKA